MSSGYGQHFKKMKSSKSAGIAPKASPQKRLRVKKRASKGKTSPVLIGTTSVGFLLCLCLFIWEDSAQNFFSKVRIGWMGGAAVAQEKIAPTKAAPAEKIAETKTTGEVKAPQNVASWGPDELSVLADLTHRKEKLDERERYLDQLDADLQRRMAEVEQRIKELEASRQEIAGLLKNQSTEDNERVDKLVETYSGMKPQNAAQVLSGLNERLAIAILTRMKKQNASDIMNFMEPTKARDLAEKFAGYKK